VISYVCDFLKDHGNSKIIFTFYLIFTFKESLKLLKVILAYILTQECVGKTLKQRAK